MLWPGPSLGVVVDGLLVGFVGHLARELLKVVESSRRLEGFGQHQEEFLDGGNVIGAGDVIVCRPMGISRAKERPVLPLAQRLWPR